MASSFRAGAPTADERLDDLGVAALVAPLQDDKAWPAGNAIPSQRQSASALASHQPSGETQVEQ
jgi:hypothetical protein